MASEPSSFTGPFGFITIDGGLLGTYGGGGETARDRDIIDTVEDVRQGLIDHADQLTKTKDDLLRDVQVLTSTIEALRSLKGLDGPKTDQAVDEAEQLIRDLLNDVFEADRLLNQSSKIRETSRAVIQAATIAHEEGA